jgi:NADH dehydrogenase
MKEKTKIVIVGGGFGGVYTARRLEKLFSRDAIEITLINRSNFFLFTPLLHEVATGGLSPTSIVEPIREVFRGTCVNFVEDEVIEVDQKTKRVITDKSQYSYDFLVIATGADTNYFGTVGAKEHCFTLKSLHDAIVLRNHILQTFEQAVETGNKDMLKVAIVGAGPTGVELAAEYAEYMHLLLKTYYTRSGFVESDIKISLVTATPDIISQFPVKMRALALERLGKLGIKVVANAIVTKVEPYTLSFKDGSSLKAHTLVWVAGVAPTLSEIKGVAVGPKGRMEVNSSLRSQNDSHTFALGDASGAFPMLAQVAVQQSKVVADNIFILATKSNKKPRSFNFKSKGLLISIGQWYAIGNFFGINVSGRIMWWVWRTIYLFNFLSWRKRFEIAGEWTANTFYPRDITYLK